MKYGSDLVVDLLQKYKIPYIPMNPGASYRGIHDSIVNYGNCNPEFIVCQHEEIAVQMAHGYAKATGKPLAAFVHNVVGLLHCNMAIYYAYLDRVPIMILGATGPVATGRRRPHIDWIHTALVQGNAIRDYVKWDDQPSDPDGILHSFAKGYRVANTDPMGPIYICYDASLQEDPLAYDVKPEQLPEPSLHTPPGIERNALNKLVGMILAAKKPLIIAEMVGRNHNSVEKLVKLAEFIAAPVVDLNARLNFPNTHPLFSMDKGLVKDADLILVLDVKDPFGCLAAVDEAGVPTGALKIKDGCKVAEISLQELEINGWSQGFQHFQGTDLSILADTAVALDEILAALKENEIKAGADSSIKNRTQMMAEYGSAYQALRKKWREQARENWDVIPMTPARMVSEVWEAIKDKDWVLSAGTVKNWARKLWDFDKPYRHPGKELGTSTQIGISMGVALAYKGTGKLVVDLQPDGDLMYDAGALWTVAYHKIPMLVVMYNNRAYYNSWDHQLKVIKQRNGSDERIRVGVEIDNPAPDFAAMARSMGWYAEGPIEDGNDLQGAVRRAIAVIEKEGRPALVDAITQYR